MKQKRNIQNNIAEVLGKHNLTNKTQVCLIQMPYFPIEYTSLALGLLKGSLDNNNISSEVIYAAPLFAEIIGFDLYNMVTKGDRLDMIGEWSFSGSAFNEYDPDHSKFIQHSAELFFNNYNYKKKHYPNGVPDIVTKITELRLVAQLFIDALAKVIISKQPKLVGCSSSFEQHIPSLAILKRVKELNPEIVTVIGGANTEDIMGVTTVAEFDWIDIAFSGEADGVFYDLCTVLLNGNHPNLINNLPYGAINKKMAAEILRQPKSTRKIPRATITNINNAPIPNFDGYFETIKKSSFNYRVKSGMILATSRGCWWGEKHACTFCGLNGCETKYHSKDTEVILKEFAEVTKKYETYQFALSDNTINKKYFNSLFPALAKLQKKYNIFFETNAGLSKDQFQIIYNMGVRWLQVGIEGLHDDLLKLMSKGVDTLTNVNFLKNTSEFGIFVIWHLLVSFPKENDNWHLETAEWLPQIYHLQPLKGIYPIRYDRFCSYQQNPNKYNMEITPFDAYSNIYPISKEAINGIAYYFKENNNTKPYNDGYVMSKGVAALNKCEDDWRAMYYSKNRPILKMTDNGDNIVIIDTRKCRVENKIILKGIHADVYRLCSSPVHISNLSSKFSKVFSYTPNSQLIEDALSYLLAKKIMLKINNKILSLAIFDSNKIPLNPFSFPGGHVDIPNIDNVLGNN